MAKSIFGSAVEELEIDVGELTPARVGMFDVVLFLGVLYHVSDPIGYLRRVYSLTREYAVVETALALEQIDEPALLFADGEPRFWPNSRAVVAMLERVGFKRVEAVVVPDDAPRGFFYAFR